jgi:hypothetical protein
MTACKMDLEMEEFGQTIAEAWNRHYLSLAVDLTIQNQETIRLHIRVRINLTAG